MHKRRVGFILVGLFIALSLVGIAIGRIAAPRLAVAQGAPALENPGFEGAFPLSGGVGELQIAEGWHEWYDRGLIRPEYTPERIGVGRGRVHSGQQAQKFFTTYAAHDAGIYQVVPAVPGTWYTFSAWGYQWSSQRDNPDQSESAGKCSVLVGINPWGDTNALYRTTVWGAEALAVYNRWTQVEVTAQAWSDTIVVVARQVCEWPVKHNDAYLDDAALVLAAIDGATAAPLPTYTPYPTYTPAATQACPTAQPGVDVDYDEIERRVRAAVETAVAGREPVRWPRE